jgi:hypothetical protein
VSTTGYFGHCSLGVGLQFKDLSAIVKSIGSAGAKISETLPSSRKESKQKERKKERKNIYFSSIMHTHVKATGYIVCT